MKGSDRNALNTYKDVGREISTNYSTISYITSKVTR